MIKRLLKRLNGQLNHMPIRVRLAVAYLFTLAIIVVLFSTFLYLQLHRALMTQLDTALEITAAQALATVDSEEGELIFESIDSESASVRRLSENSSIHLLDNDGVVLDRLGSEDEAPTVPPFAGVRTINTDGKVWRIYSEPIALTDAPVTGWLQVAQGLAHVESTLDTLLIQLAWGAPLALLLAGSGGLWLAARALRPIDRITRTAQSINGSDLGQRIGYRGPEDEVGRLADTFDKMLDRLQAAFDRQYRFTGDAAHELRTPLAALKGRIGVTLNQSEEPLAYRAALEEMDQQVDRLIYLSTDLLFMARMDQGCQRLELEEIEVDELMATLVEQVSILAQEKEITIQTQILQAMTIRGDIDLLIRLFLNLLDNAIKYTWHGGTVTIDAHPEKGGGWIRISDTGPGISEEHLPHLFERFYRGARDRVRQDANNFQSGAGLGLAIANEIVSLHSGKLTVTSRLGEGAIFSVWLPEGEL